MPSRPAPLYPSDYETRPYRLEVASASATTQPSRTQHPGNQPYAAAQPQHHPASPYATGPQQVPGPQYATGQQYATGPQYVADPYATGPRYLPVEPYPAEPQPYLPAQLQPYGATPHPAAAIPPYPGARPSRPEPAPEPRQRLARPAADDGETRPVRRPPARPPVRKASRTPLLLRATLVTAVLAAAGASVLRAQTGPPDPSVALGGNAAQAAATAPAPVAEGAPARGCRVKHSVTSRSGGRFTSVLTVVNTGAATVKGWTLRWDYPDQVPDSGLEVGQGWNATVAMEAPGVKATNTDLNRVIAPGGTTTIGFVGTTDGTVPVPADFTLNGVSCR